MASFRLGRQTTKAIGSPRTSANQTSLSRSSGRSSLARCSTSSGVKGTKPQWPAQASLKIAMSAATSSRNAARRIGRSATPEGSPRATKAAAPGGSGVSASTI